jgi:hypothetical protein
MEGVSSFQFLVSSVIRRWKDRRKSVLAVIRAMAELESSGGIKFLATTTSEWKGKI